MRTVGRIITAILLASLLPACSGGPPDPLPPAPVMPSTVTAVPVSTCQFELTWTISPGATSYQIWRSTDTVTYTLIATVFGGAISSYNDLGLQPNSFYVYRVVAVNRGGSSPPGEDPNFYTTFPAQWEVPTTAGTPPSLRAAHSAVYDSIGQRMIVFGGSNPALLGDLYELTLPAAGTPTWSLLSPSGTPPTARAGHSAVFDSVNNRMIVFGGQDATGSLQELWVLTLGVGPTWTKITTATGTPPGARRDHVAVYDPVRREMTVYGGQDAGFLVDGNLHVLSCPSSGTFAWSTATPITAPPLPRTNHAAAHDPMGPRMITFGGLDQDLSDGTSLSGETWTYSATGNQWIQLSFTSGPAGKQGPSAIYDSLNRRMVVFGGGGNNFQPETPPTMWALNLFSQQPAWTTIVPDPPSIGSPPPPLEYHSAIYDGLNHRMVVFGGRTTSSVYTNGLYWIVQ